MILTLIYFRTAIWLHIPDGFLSLGVSLFFWLITAGCLFGAIRRVHQDLDDRQVPLMGMLAAFIFAAQMLNFPIAGGTSGHLLGGALAAMLLGPWAAILVMSAVIATQALLFQDGGLLAMGANIFNMGILTAFVGFGFYRSSLRASRRVQWLVAGVAAWISVMVGALATSLQLWLSGTAALAVVLPAMLGVHAFIGVGEALITVGALMFIGQTRPELLSQAQIQARGGRGWILAGGLITLIALFLAPWASASPDGLMSVAQRLGFIQLGQSAPYQLLPNYTVPFLGASPLSTILAGLIGATIVSVLVFLLARRGRRIAKG